MRLTVPSPLGAAPIADAMRFPELAGPSVRWIAGGGHVVGPARTVALSRGDNLGLHLAIGRCRPGDVLVATGSGEFGYWGEILSAAARRAGVAGIVIDGHVRDIDAIEDLGFPVYGRGTALRKTAKLDAGLHGGTITVGAARVSDGDLVVADRDGVVFVPSGESDSVLVRAQEIAMLEDGFLNAVLGGATTTEVLGLSMAVPVDFDWEPGTRR